MQNIMTRQEFNDRTGYRLNEEQYKEVETMYIAAGNMNEDVIGEKGVVLITIATGLPLFEEDAEYIKNNIR